MTQTIATTTCTTTPVAPNGPDRDQLLAELSACVRIDQATCFLEPQAGTPEHRRAVANRRRIEWLRRTLSTLTRTI